MAIVTVNTASEAMALANKYGIPWPMGKGRKPKAKLWYAITGNGHTIAGSYLEQPRSPLGLITKESIGTGIYEVSRRTMIEGTNTKGKKYRVPKTETVRLTVREIRELTGKLGQKGRIGDANIKRALVVLRDEEKKALGWTDEDIASVTPVSIDPANAKPRKRKAKTAATVAAVVVAKPANDDSGQDDPTDANDLVSVEISGLGDPAITVTASPELATELSA